MFYYKSPDEMKALFGSADTLKSVESLVEEFEDELERDILPAFDIPEEFNFEEDEKDGGSEARMLIWTSRI